MNGLGDFFVKLFLACIGLVIAALTLFYALATKQEGAAWLSAVSVLSGLLLVVLSVQEIRIILNLFFNNSKNAAEPEDAPTELVPVAGIATSQFFEVVKKSRNESAISQATTIDDVYKKMKPYLAGERGLIILGSQQSNSEASVTLRQILNGEKTLDQLICKNIYADLDLLPDSEVNFTVDRKAVENMLITLWADYYKIVILVEEYEEEFWRTVARNINYRMSLAHNHEVLTVPAIKRKRPITYRNLSRFELFQNKGLE